MFFFLLIQYEFFLINFILSKSLPNNLTIKLKGVRTIKKTIIIIIGAIIFPKISPNFIHKLFKGFNNLEFNRPKNKKIIDIIKDHNL